MKTVKKIEHLDIGHIKRTQENNFHLKLSDVSGDENLETGFPHRHNFFMICLVVQGRGTHVIDFEEIDIVPNRLFFLKPDQVHFWDVTPPSSLAVAQFTESFMTQLFGLEVLSVLTSVDTCYFDLTTEKSATLLDVFTHMENELHSGERYADKIIQADLFILLTEIERLSHTFSPTSLKNNKAKLLQEFKHLLNQRFNEITTIEGYARLLYITPNYLNIIVKETTGKTANALMHEKVFLEAKRMLIQQDADITQIAYDLGFKDASYFARFFKKASGQRPSDFRAEMVKMYQHPDN